VAARADPDLGALATMEPRSSSIKFEIKDNIIFGPGVALLAVPTARYPTFASPGGVVARAGSTDQRLTWALSLGLSYPALDGRGRGGPTLWLPQFIVAPAADQGPTFGLGAAVSWKVVRVGLGAAWVRSEKLSAPQLGSTLAPGATITTVKSYDLMPKLYLDVGLVF
jgi:hypothetical protein